MFYAILGGPATGKGTISKILCQELHIPHISTGDILRKVSKTDPAIQLKLDKGLLIPDDIITNLLYQRISEPDCSNGCVIDGYPRSLSQALLLDEMLEKLGEKLSATIELTVPDELVFRRVLERKECIKCGNTYGLDMPSKVKNICDDCKSELVRRSDDTEETLKTRIDLYKIKSKPIIDYYKDNGLLITVDASDNPDKILKVIDCN